MWINILGRSLLRNCRVVWDGVGRAMCRLGGTEIRCDAKLRLYCVIRIDVVWNGVKLVGMG